MYSRVDSRRFRLVDFRRVIWMQSSLKTDNLAAEKQEVLSFSLLASAYESILAAM